MDWSQEPLESKTVNQLKDYLRSHGLKLIGNKPDLLERVRARVLNPPPQRQPSLPPPARQATIQADQAGGHNPKGLHFAKTEVEMKQKGLYISRQAPNSPAFNLCDGGYWNSLDKQVQDKMSERMHNIDFIPTVHNEKWFQDRLEDCVKEVVQNFDPELLWSIAVHKYVHLKAVKEKEGESLVSEPHDSVRKFFGIKYKYE